MRKLTKVQAAYLAGMVDGEGCISILRARKATQGHSSVFRIVSTDKAVLDYLLEITGLGYVRDYATSRNERNKNCKPQWGWQFSSVGMRELLPVILPYLITKREVAETALELLQSSLARGKGVSSEEKARRAVLYERLKRLNHRGLS
ncbi:hypothetical protein LCGC14_0796330 [marine sediment metagenome]|uniref:Homing endonuclease LAGLIDADG domain-containing protein n=1 Tax=marine sediment metagenome TaxID=412755 RepID=A0A0F9PVE4_9ZZZZ